MSGILEWHRKATRYTPEELQARRGLDAKSLQ
jgi:hypothetical protein